MGAPALAIHCVETADSAEPDAVWAVAAELETTTLFGGFKLDQTTYMATVRVKDDSKLIPAR